MDDANCARDGTGGGGAVCLYLRRTVTFANCTFINNTAIAGGGMHLQQRCLPGETGCGPAVMYDTWFTNNAAYRGGGGAFFRTTHNLTVATCPGETNYTAVEQLHNACNRWGIRVVCNRAPLLQAV